MLSDVLRYATIQNVMFTVITRRSSIVSPRNGLWYCRCDPFKGTLLLEEMESSFHTLSFASHLRLIKITSFQLQRPPRTSQVNTNSNPAAKNASTQSAGLKCRALASHFHKRWRNVCEFKRERSRETRLCGELHKRGTNKPSVTSRSSPRA